MQVYFGKTHMHVRVSQSMRLALEVARQHTIRKKDPFRPKPGVKSRDRKCLDFQTFLSSTDIAK